MNYNVFGGMLNLTQLQLHQPDMLIWSPTTMFCYWQCSYLVKRCGRI